MRCFGWLGRVGTCCAFAIAVGWAVAGGAIAANAQSRTSSIDVPAGALGDALYAYSSATGLEVLVSRDMVAGRRSAAVAGIAAPDAALRVLLNGTGLVPRYVGDSAFTLVPVSPAAAPATFATPSYPEYSAALQAAVTGALCRFHAAEPGDYRLATRLWIGPSGTVRQVRLLGTTGDERRDAILATQLGRMAVGMTPPAQLAQPTTVLILPQKDMTVACREHVVAP